MFLTCQVDLPGARTMKSAQSQCLGTSITLTSSALISIKTFSISSRSRRHLRPSMADKKQNCTFFFHGWLRRRASEYCKHVRVRKIPTFEYYDQIRAKRASLRRIHCDFVRSHEKFWRRCHRHHLSPSPSTNK